MFYITMNHGIITDLLFILSAGIKMSSASTVRVNCDTGTNLDSPSGGNTTARVLFDHCRRAAAGKRDIV
jgi:hypothetical protein